MARFMYTGVASLCILAFAGLAPGCATCCDIEGDDSDFDSYVPDFSPPPDESEILNIDGIGPNEPITAKAVRVLMAKPEDEARKLFIGFSAGINEAHIAAFTDDAAALSEIASVHPRLLKAKDYRGRTPLCISAKYGCANAARELIRQGVPKNRRCIFDTPLITASKFGHVEVVRVLLEAGARVDARSSYDRKTALGEAALFGYPEVVLELLNQGADPNIRDRYGKTPLIYSASEWEPDCTVHLLSFGADVHTASEDKITALHCVNKRKVAKVLVEHGAPINPKDYAGNTPLHRVAWGAETYSPPGGEEKRRAFNSDLVTLAGFLIESGADPTIRNKDGQTPREIAMEGGVTEMISLLEHAETAWRNQNRAAVVTPGKSPPAR